jgi:hypothetical protein
MAGTASDPFFWSDWAADPCLKVCSHGAQGLWMRLLCIAAEAKPQKGFVMINGRKPSVEELTAVVGGTVEQVKSELEELQKWGVFSVDRRGVIYCRRIVRAEKMTSKMRDMGKIGGRVTYEKQKGIFAQSRTGLDETPVSRARAPSPSPFSSSSSLPSSCESGSDNSVPSVATSAEPSEVKAAALDAPPEPFIEIPTNKDGETYPVFPSLVSEYERSYPNVDIEQQLREMRAWSLSNRTKRKTKGGMARFINSWLAKEQNRGGDNSRAAKKVQIAEKAEGERRLWLRVYEVDGRWIPNSSTNGVWKDSAGVGAPPHDERTLVTEEDLAQFPKAKLMRERLQKAASGVEAPIF